MVAVTPRAHGSAFCDILLLVQPANLTTLSYVYYREKSASGGSHGSSSRSSCNSQTGSLFGILGFDKCDGDICVVGIYPQAHDADSIPWSPLSIIIIVSLRRLDFFFVLLILVILFLLLFFAVYARLRFFLLLG